MRFAAVADVPDETDLLTPRERSRRDRLVSADDRDAYVAAHVLVRRCAAELLGLAVEDVVLAQRCPTCGSDDHGRPYAGGTDVHLSLSHTRGTVAAMAAYARCGVDVETAHDGPPPHGTLTAREEAWVAERPDPGLAFTRLWVRKEALVKAGVAGLAEAGELDVLQAGPDGLRPADLRDGVVLAEWRGAGAVGAWAVARPSSA